MDTRINLFMGLPIASLDQLRIKQEIAAIGSTPLIDCWYEHTGRLIAVTP
jgi:hypothetical protein